MGPRLVEVEADEEPRQARAVGIGLEDAPEARPGRTSRRCRRTRSRRRRASRPDRSGRPRRPARRPRGRPRRRARAAPARRPAAGSRPGSGSSRSPTPAGRRSPGSSASGPGEAPRSGRRPRTSRRARRRGRRGTRAGRRARAGPGARPGRLPGAAVPYPVALPRHGWHQQPRSSSPSRSSAMSSQRSAVAGTITRSAASDGAPGPRRLRAHDGRATTGVTSRPSRSISRVTSSPGSR